MARKTVEIVRDQLEELSMGSPDEVIALVKAWYDKMRNEEDDKIIEDSIRNLKFELAKVLGVEIDENLKVLELTPEESENPYPESMDNLEYEKMRGYFMEQHREFVKNAKSSGLSGVGDNPQKMPSFADLDLSDEVLAKVKKFRSPQLIMVPKYASLQDMKTLINDRRDSDEPYISNAYEEDIGDGWERRIIEMPDRMPTDERCTGKTMNSDNSVRNLGQIEKELLEWHKTEGTEGINGMNFLTMVLLDLEKGNTNFNEGLIDILTGQNGDNAGFLAYWRYGRPFLDVSSPDRQNHGLRGRDSVRV